MSDETAPQIDMNDHQNTYAGFIRFSKIGIIVVLNILLCLILFSYAGGAGAFFGTVLLIASFIAAIVGMISGDNGWIPPMGVLLITMVVWIITVG